MRIRWAFTQALSRPPEESELKTLTALYTSSVQTLYPRSADADRLIHVGETPVSGGVQPTQLAAMTTVTRAVLNLHELITRD